MLGTTFVPRAASFKPGKTSRTEKEAARQLQHKVAKQTALRLDQAHTRFTRSLNEQSAQLKEQVEALRAEMRQQTAEQRQQLAELRQELKPQLDQLVAINAASAVCTIAVAAVAAGAATLSLAWGLWHLALTLAVSALRDPAAITPAVTASLWVVGAVCAAVLCAFFYFTGRRPAAGASAAATGAS